ncbi:hypothetical protein [Williamsia sterculiae]|uniref:Condensation domain-containing protein n=1 Tax=Williamsia sterculiae TaxID=1344003 RepID=A0A1N7DTT8_9NOCA|nr:hypothetical protein [Williamsia sterculiae]SIR79208.1 hypothetical protein SAMN05445060_0900 [Williamsia sterculiae]
MTTGTPTPSRSTTEPGLASRRLADEDSTFWFLRRALGWDVVLQTVWVFDGAIPDSALRRMHAGLECGRLHRTLVASRIPGARPRWVGAGVAAPLVVDTETVSTTGVETWAATEMATVDLDPEQGRCWRLRAAPMGDGCTVVSLCALHQVTDGRLMVQSAATAMTADPSPADGRVRSAPVTPVVVGDVVDAAGRVLAVGRGVVRAVVAGWRPGGDPVRDDIERPVRPEAARRSPRATGALATVSVPTHRWDSVAAAHGGTPNALFVAVVTGLLRSGGHAPVGVPIKVGLPVDRRRGDTDLRANATAGVSITLTDDPVSGGDLGSIRALCKAAYQRLEAGQRAATVHLQPLVWLLPASWLIGAATAGSGMPDAMVSNLGDVPAGAQRLGGCRARRITFRGMAQNVDPDLPYRFGDGAQAWLLRTDDQVTFTVWGFDETLFVDESDLGRQLGAELSAWDLPYELW